MMDREVSVSDYANCVRAGRCTANYVWTLGGNKILADDGTVNPAWANRAYETTSSGDATAYCDYMRMRVPLLDEWRVAAGFADKRAFPWGNEAPKDDVCWAGPDRRYAPPFDGPCDVATSPKDKSPLGLFDMGGNVREWVSVKGADGVDGDLWVAGGAYDSRDPEELAQAMKPGDGTRAGIRCARSTE
jgi:formylglycine-generating enzyme required for sulfatase activity